MGRDHLLFGRRVLEEAIAAQVKIKGIYFEHDGARKLLENLAVRKVPMKKGIPEKVSRLNHQGVAFEIEHDFYIQTLPDPLPKLTVLCNHLEDVGNLGSIVRSAAAFGGGLIIHEKKRSVHLTDAAIRVSAGMAFRLKFMEVANIERVLGPMKDSGAWVVGLTEEASQDLYQWEPRFPLALVLGSEEKGMAKPVLKQLDEPLRISMKKGIDSLNVSQAASIAMSWIYGKTS